MGDNLRTDHRRTHSVSISVYPSPPLTHLSCMRWILCQLGASVPRGILPPTGTGRHPVPLASTHRDREAPRTASLHPQGQGGTPYLEPPPTGTGRHPVPRASTHRDREAPRTSSLHPQGQGGTPYLEPPPTGTGRHSVPLASTHRDSEAPCTANLHPQGQGGTPYR